MTDSKEKEFFFSVLMGLLIAAYIFVFYVWIDATEMYKQSYQLVIDYCSVGKPIEVIPWNMT